MTGATGWRSKWVNILGILFLIFSTTTPGKARSAADTWTLLSQIGGKTQAVAVAGGIAYVGVGLRLSLFNVGSPTNPVLLGSSAPFAQDIQDIAVSTSRAFVAAGGAGVGIVDVSNTAHPNVLGTWKSSGFAEGIAVNGNTIYLADGPYGLRILDAANPSAILETGSAYSFHYALDVAVSGNYAYVAAGGSGLLVVNVADPAHPVELAQLNTPGWAYEVAVSGNIAYVADAWAGVAVMDISNPAYPAQIGHVATPGWALSLAASGASLYVGEGVDGVHILNISNPAALYETGSYTGNGLIRRVAASGSTVYAADTDKGLRILNASNPAAPLQTAIAGQISDARRVAIAGSYAYVAAGNEGAMYIFNVSDPANPSQTGKYAAAGYASGVALNGNFAYLSTYVNTPNYLWVLNVSNPSKPGLTAVIPTSSVTPQPYGAAMDVIVRGNYAYVPDELQLRIYDISAPAGIHQQGQIYLNYDNNTASEVALSGNFAFVANAKAGVRVIDVATPSNPLLVNTFPVNGAAGSVATTADRLYTGTGDTIYVVDITSPGVTLPLLGTYATPSQVAGLTISGSDLFTSMGLGGIQVLNVSDPAHISVSAWLETPGFAWQSVLVGNLLYVADGSGGLLIFQKQAGAAASPALPPDAQTSGEPDPAQFQMIQEQLHPSRPAHAAPAAPDVAGQDPVQPEPAGSLAAARTCVVGTTADSGAGSLRNCLTGPASGTIITFNPAIFPPSSPAVIRLSSQLPTLKADHLTIDASNAGVILDGGNAIYSGLVVASSYATIMGLQVRGFTGDCIFLDGPSRYGLVGGDHTVGSGPSGQGNVVNCALQGIHVLSDHNVVKGNFVGTNAGGTAAGSGNQTGVAVGSVGMNGAPSLGNYNQIGGPTPGERNIVGANQNGIDVFSAWNTIAGNYVGTDITGNLAIPNTRSGIVLEMGAHDNVVGGVTPAERNVTSGNAFAGVVISDPSTAQNTIIGNYIGVNASGTAAIPNQFAGVFVAVGPFNKIGGSQPGEGNLISGNSQGVYIYALGNTHTIVTGNRIGFDADGRPTLENTIGVVLLCGSRSFIGGVNGGEGNRINQLGDVYSLYGPGISIFQAGTTYSWVAGNTIIGGETAGIDIYNYSSHNFIVRNTITGSNPAIQVKKGTENTLRANAISGNPAGIWLSEGGNQLLAAPVIAGLNETGVSGTACANCRVEIFSDYGDQGLRYEGATVADSSGQFTFSRRLYGPNVTATATDGAGNTSTFSAPAAVSWTWTHLYLPLAVRGGP